MDNFVIMTVDRPNKYVYKLITRLRKDLAIRLVVGSPNYTYLERYRNNPAIEVIGIDPADWLKVKDYSVKLRACWNYWRCLTCGTKPGSRAGLVILEDDVLPARNWEKKLAETIRQLDAEYDGQYVLSLYTSYTELSKPADGNGWYTHYPAAAFFGTQGMYYPEPVRLGFAEYLKTESFRNHYDLLLGEYLRRTGIPLFVTTPCLFEHIGEVSTGLCPFFHRAGYLAKSTPQKA